MIYLHSCFLQGQVAFCGIPCFVTRLVGALLFTTGNPLTEEPLFTPPKFAFFFEILRSLGYIYIYIYCECESVLQASCELVPLKPLIHDRSLGAQEAHRQWEVSGK